MFFVSFSIYLFIYFLKEKFHIIHDPHSSIRIKSSNFFSEMTVLVKILVLGDRLY